MLANDTTEQKRSGGFFLLVDARGAVAELMAECAKCGAITTCALELSSRLRTVTCSQCQASTRLGVDDLIGLRTQLVDARVRIDRLIDPEERDPPSSPADRANE